MFSYTSSLMMKILTVVLGHYDKHHYAVGMEYRLQLPNTDIVATLQPGYVEFTWRRIFLIKRILRTTKRGFKLSYLDPITLSERDLYIVGAPSRRHLKYLVENCDYFTPHRKVN